MSKSSQTLHLSDTVDHFNRRIHVNVRNGKVTMVYRWKDRTSPKMHTQRTTLDDTQAARLLGLLTKQVQKAIPERDEARTKAFTAAYLDELRS
ncbi:hypothetical protein ZD95_22 [Escherichia phage P1723]|uniref:Uncharacterized protein n=1 Tax=Escherichia phage P1723 TaxID=2736274 RepID=A0A6M9QBJ8_9CAUD|nr:hypothetical protein ZD95_22 [Escherichia phage P1723]